jgi:hypothetical protein
VPILIIRPQNYLLAKPWTVHAETFCLEAEPPFHSLSLPRLHEILTATYARSLPRHRAGALITFRLMYLKMRR